MASQQAHIQRFNPFESRRCRTVRNELGQALLAAIFSGDLATPTRVAERHAPAGAAETVKQYARDRMARYRDVLQAIHAGENPISDVWSIAGLLWHRHLFFECHEWLEMKWRRSEGPEKKMIQACIWSVGAYAHLEYGRIPGARKLASRAIAGLRQYRERVPACLDVDRLVEKLECLDGGPPRFDDTCF